MKTAVDTTVILDVITNDPLWADASEAALLEAVRRGALIINECVLAEISPALSDEQVIAFLSDWNMQFVPTSRAAALNAGRMYARYLQRGGKQGRVLPDFLIGAHALDNGAHLLARDRGYYRDYFSGLQVIEPS